MDGCPAFDPNAPYVGAVIAYANCHALSLGETAFRAFGAGTPFGIALTGLLTIFVALVGYRMLLGSVPSLREGVLLALRLGIVLTLATQWPAYKALVFDVVTGAPGEFVAGGAGGEAADLSPASLAARIDRVNDALASLLAPPAAPQPAQAPVPAQPGLVAAPAPTAPVQQPGTLPIAAQFPVETAAVALTVSALGGLLSVTATMGLMLALGPLFILSLLFAWTRGLFLAWVRVLLGAMLGAVAVPLVLSLDLGIVERQVAVLVDLVGSNQPTGFLPLSIAATTLASAVVLLAVFAAVIRAASGLRLPEAVRESIAPLLQPVVPQRSAMNGNAREGSMVQRREDERGRVAQLADAVRLQARRDADALPEQVRITRLAGAVASQNETAATGGLTGGAPLGQTGRRIRQRRTIGAQRRDMTR